MAEARAVRDRLMAHRRNTPLALEKTKASTKYGTSTYYVSIGGFEVRKNRKFTSVIPRGAGYGTSRLPRFCVRRVYCSFDPSQLVLRT